MLSRSHCSIKCRSLELTIETPAPIHNNTSRYIITRHPTNYYGWLSPPAPLPTPSTPIVSQTTHVRRSTLTMTNCGYKRSFTFFTWHLTLPAPATKCYQVFSLLRSSRVFSVGIFNLNQWFSNWICFTASEL